MIPVDIAWLLGTALLAGSLTALLVFRLRKKSKPSGNIVDLAAARRRKLESVSGKNEETGSQQPKRTAVSSAAGSVRAFTPKKAESSGQLCSHCRKKSNSIGFYADDYGKLVGLCKECRKSSKNRDLMPL